jgi:hypothetical protein
VRTFGALKADGRRCREIHESETKARIRPAMGLIRACFTVRGQLRKLPGTFLQPFSPMSSALLFAAAVAASG